MTNTPTTATPTKATELTFDPGGGLEPLLEFELAVLVWEEGGESLCPPEVGGGGGDDSALVTGETSVGGDGLDFWGGEVGSSGEEMAIGEETRGDGGGGACIADGVFSVAAGGGGGGEGESGNDCSGDGGVDCLLGLGGGDDGGWGGGEALEFDGGGGAFESPDSNGGEGVLELEPGDELGGGDPKSKGGEGAVAFKSDWVGSGEGGGDFEIGGGGEAKEDADSSGGGEELDDELDGTRFCRPPNPGGGEDSENGGGGDSLAFDILPFA